MFTVDFAVYFSRARNNLIQYQIAPRSDEVNGNVHKTLAFNDVSRYKRITYKPRNFFEENTRGSFEILSSFTTS